MKDDLWKRELRPLLDAKSVAIVGATEKPSPSKNTICNLLDMDFKGDIFPVNPKRETVLGLKCYKSLTDIPSIPELVVISVHVSAVISVLEQCAQMKVPAVMVYSSGFAEAGADGKILQDKMQEICEANQIRLCGPNCLGSLNVTSKSGAYSATVPIGVECGSVAVVSQSGSMAIGMLQALKELGISNVISIGNQAVLDMSDYLHYLSSDPNTKVIATFIEGFKDGRRFMESAMECAKQGKIIVALKVGKSELSRTSISSHTAAMVGSDVVFNDAMLDCGVLLVSDIDEMRQLVTLLVKSEKASTDGVVLVTISGGQVSMVADIAAAMGINIKYPKFNQETFNKLRPIIPNYLRVANPLDLAGVGEGNYEEYAEVLRICADDPSVGMILVSQDAPLGLGDNTIAHYSHITKAVTEVFNENKKPIVMFSNHSTPSEPRIIKEMVDAGVPYLQGTRETVLAVSHFINYSTRNIADQHKTKSLRKYPHTWKEIAAKLDSFTDKKLSFLAEKESKEVFSMLGINVARQILCNGNKELLSAASVIGYPVVMKVDSPNIAHKTEVKGVVTGIADDRTLLAEYEMMLRNVHECAPEAKIAGVTLQKMVPDGVDLIIGTHTDLQFGPVLMFGMGGIYVEVFKDSSLGLVPMTPEKARQVIANSKSSRLLKEFRGRAALDTESLVDVMLRISDFAEYFKDRVASVDINPIRIGTFGVIVLDALIVFKK